MLDNKFDLAPVFQYGSRILQECLTVEVKITFANTHQGQMSLGRDWQRTRALWLYLPQLYGR